jgi:hypothetical protein
MGMSLQEQLLKAGLVDKKKTSQARKQQQKQRRQPGNGSSAAEQAKAAARAASERQTQKDRELNLQRKAAAERKALQAQIRQLVASNRVATEGGEIAYHFTYGGKIRTLLVSAAQQAQLASGALVIVALDREYALVAREVAEKIHQRDAGCVIAPSDAAPAGDDDAYAGYEVPDDLVW